MTDKTFKLLTALTVSVGIIVTVGMTQTGCASTVGANPTAPTKVESMLFDTITNTVTVTNTVQQITPYFVTNTVTLTVTNQQNQVITTVSNIVNEAWHTNLISVVTNAPGYTETPKAATTAGIAAGGSILNAFVPGVGTMVMAGLTALVGLWGKMRSTKLTATGASLAQEIETIREFIQTLPNGQSYDTAIVQYLKDHQTETDVITQVIGLIGNEVSNPDAKVAAQLVVNTVNSLKATSTPLPAVNAAN